MEVGQDHARLGDDHARPVSRRRMRFIRRVERISADPSAGGVAPPTIELFPPCGTSVTRYSVAARSTACTWPASVGARIAGAWPEKRGASPLPMARSTRSR